MTAPDESTLSALSALCEAGAEYYRRGWMLATAGNLSIRDAGHPERYWVTASGGHKGRLRAPGDFIRFEHGMRAPAPADKKSSAETVVHDLLYAAHGGIHAIHHVHAPRGTLISRAHGAGAIWRVEGLEYIKALGFWGEDDVVEIPIVKNHAHIPALAEAVAEASARDLRVPAVLVEGHGVYAWGDSGAAAQRHTEAIEFLADICWEERLRR